jgi:hypothetical protein
LVRYLSSSYSSSFLVIYNPSFTILGAIRDDGESADEDDEGENNDAGSDRDITTPPSPGPIMNDDDFLGDNMLGSPGGSPVRNLELDESKQFFELVQQFMTEYTASAKVGTECCGESQLFKLFTKAIFFSFFLGVCALNRVNSSCTSVARHD